MDNVASMDKDKGLIMSLLQIQEWNPNLAAHLQELNRQHRDALEWIYHCDSGLRQKYASHSDEKQDYQTVHIYQQPADEYRNRPVKCMRCNLCWEFTKIANDHDTNADDKMKCPMAKFWASYYCEYNQSDLKEHFNSPSHHEVVRYITFMRIKTKMITHEFGGHPKVSQLLQDAVTKLTMERLDDQLQHTFDIVKMKKVASHHEELRHNKRLEPLSPEKRMLYRWFSLRMIDPPFYRNRHRNLFNAKRNIHEMGPIEEVLNPLDETLLFNSDQKIFLENIIRQCVQQSDHLHQNLHRNLHQQNTFKVHRNINSLLISRAMRDDPRIRRITETIAVLKPMIMKRIFQSLIRNTPLDQPFDSKQLRLKLQDAKNAVISDTGNIKQLHGLNTRRNNWEFQDLETSLIFDIHCIYRIDQYVTRGIFDTTLTMLRDRIGAKELDNHISMDEATAFTDAAAEYQRDLVQPLRFKKSYVINGRVTEYMMWIFAFSSVLKETMSMLKEKGFYELQFQCDLVLIADSVLDVFTGRDITEDQCGHSMKSMDISANLRSEGIPFVTALLPLESDKYKTDLLKRTAFKTVLKNLWMDLMDKIGMNQGMNQNLKNRRVVILIEKRRVLHNDSDYVEHGFHDVLYMFQSKGYLEKPAISPSASRSARSASKLLELSNDGIMHYLTQKYLIPQGNGRWIGAADAVHGRFFTYSFHIHALDLKRCYLSFCGGTTRTFPEHFVNLIPKFFVYHWRRRSVEEKDCNVDKKSFMKTLYSHEYKHGFDLYLEDSAFLKYYRRLTGYFHVSVNYRRIKMVTVSYPRNQHQSKRDILEESKQQIEEKNEEIQNCDGQNDVVAIVDRQLVNGDDVQLITEQNVTDCAKPIVSVKSMQELSVEEFCMVIAAVIENDPKGQTVNLSQVKDITKEKNITGASFCELKKLAFSKLYKKAGIKGGFAMNIFKKLNGLTPEEIGVTLKGPDQVDAEEERKSDDVNPLNLTKHVPPQNLQNLQEEKEIATLTATNDINSDIKEDQHEEQHEEKTIADLNVDEMYLMMKHCASRLELDIDADRLRDELALDGPLLAARTKKQFAKLVKPLGIKGGPAYKLWTEINTNIDSEAMINILKSSEEDKLHMLQDVPLETLNVEQLSHLFVCIARDVDVFTEYETLRKCMTAISENQIDGKTWMTTKPFKLTKQFKPIMGMKAGPLSKALKAIHQWTLSESANPGAISRKLLEPQLCSGKLEECPNIEFLGEILNRFHNKSREQLMETLLSDVDTIKVLNYFHHLKTAHSMFGKVKERDMSRIDDDDREDSIELEADEQYMKFQHKIHECMTAKIGACNSDANTCYFILRHSRDRERVISDQYNDATNGLVLDVIARIHTLIFHRVGDQLYRMYDRERALRGEYKDDTEIGKDIGNEKVYEDDTKNEDVARRDAHESTEWVDADGNEHLVGFMSPDSVDVDSDKEEEKEKNIKSLSINLKLPETELQKSRSNRFCSEMDFLEPVADDSDADSEIVEDQKENELTQPPNHDTMKPLESLQVDLKEDEKHNEPELHDEDNAPPLDKNVGSKRLSDSIESPSSLSKFSSLPLPEEIYQKVVKKKKYKKKKRGRPEKEDIAPLLFGQRLDDWFGPLVKPIFANMKEEVTRNEYNRITLKDWGELWEKCQLLIQTDKNTMMYSAEEIMALKLYTDCDKLCTMLRRTFWEKTSIHQKRSLFHWAMNLQKVMCYGATPLEQKRVFHGLSKLFTVKNLRPIFNGPLSTSKNKSCAKSFKGDDGILWVIQPRPWSELELPLGIDVDKMSICQFEEGEVLLMNCPLPIQKSTFESDKQRKIEYLLDYLEKYDEEIKDKNKFWKMAGLDIAAGITQPTDKQRQSDATFEKLLIRLGRNPRLWAPSQRPVPFSKLRAWMNITHNTESLCDDYWNDLLLRRMANLLRVMSKEGMLLKAFEMLKKYNFKHPRMWMVLLNGCRMHQDETMGEKVYQEIQERFAKNDRVMNAALNLLNRIRIQQKVENDQMSESNTEHEDEMQKEEKSKEKAEGEGDRPYAYGYVVKWIFANQKIANEQAFASNHSVEIRQMTDTHHYLNMRKVKQRERSNLKQNRLERPGAIRILSLLRGVPTTMIGCDRKRKPNQRSKAKLPSKMDQNDDGKVNQNGDQNGDQNAKDKESDEKALKLFIGKSEGQIYQMLTKRNNEIAEIKLNLSVYHRLVNQLDLIYLPFAAFTRVQFRGPIGNSSQYRLSNLFQHARAASIIHLPEGMPLLQEMCRKHRVRYKLTFRFRPDKRLSMMDQALDHALERAFISDLKLNGTQFIQNVDDKDWLETRCDYLARKARTSSQVMEYIFDEMRKSRKPEEWYQVDVHTLYGAFRTQMNRTGKTDYIALRVEWRTVMKLDGPKFEKIKHDEFKMIMLSLRLAKIAHISPADILMVFEDMLGKKEKGKKETVDMTDAELCDEFEKQLRLNIELSTFKEKRQSNFKFRWQFIEIGVDQVQKRPIFLNVADCANFSLWNQGSLWMYQLKCCVEDVDPNKWVEIDKNRCVVDLDCVIGPRKTMNIRSHKAVSKNLCRKKKMHRNVWIFRSLRLRAHSKLTVEPFGYNFIDKQMMDKVRGDDDPHFHFGCIRIFCYEDIVMEEHATIDVNGKGMFGSVQTEHLNPGRGGHVYWKQTRSAEVEKAESVYSGGGYGTPGKGVVDHGNGVSRIVRPGHKECMVEGMGCLDLKENCKWKRSDDEMEIVSGGKVYGDARLDTLHYGSSGGRGCLDLKENAADCYRQSDRGGGIIELIARRIIIHKNAKIMANGKTGYQGQKRTSGGSGGSIKIRCHEFVNDGRIEAVGGQFSTIRSHGAVDGENLNYSPVHGDGGAGRIAIYCDEYQSSSGNIYPKPFRGKANDFRISKLPRWEKLAENEVLSNENL